MDIERMSPENEILGFELQGRIRGGPEARTIVEFLKEKMDDPNRVERRKSLKERLRLTRIGCCGATWGLRPANISVRDDEDGGGQEELQIGLINVEPTTPEIGSTPVCLVQTPARSGMNLATALAAERQFRAAQEVEGEVDISPSLSPNPNPSPIRPNNDVNPRASPGTPYRVSLMRLLEQSDACDEEEEKPLGCDTVCCVCMVRKKGAAFIPCGHTFCRVCSRELWLNRGSCPLCSRSIVEILDIF